MINKEKIMNPAPSRNSTIKIIGFKKLNKKEGAG